MKIIECVPNFSEGRNDKILAAIQEAICSVEAVQFLDADKGRDTNRTVMTFVGSPQAVLEAAYAGIAKACELIDMSKHRGEHPRMGACDVCPFIPVSNVSMQECVELAKQLGQRVGAQLGLPVYLYEYAATSAERKNLATLRAGEYEGLKEKLDTPELVPDYGPQKYNDTVKKCGATVIGARDFLIAYNINLNSMDKRKANDLAFRLREKGRSVRTGNITPDYFQGDIVRYSIRENEFPCALCNHFCENAQDLQNHCLEAHNHDWLGFMKKHWDLVPEDLEGQAVKEPGLFTHCKAIGWVVESLGCAQVSINLTNYRESPPHLVLEACRDLAAQCGLVVTGSEIVGLIPFDALYEAGQYYLARQRAPRGVPVTDVLQCAIKSMGLNDLAPFDISQKVLGLPPEALPLASLSLQAFSAECSRASVAPGGGSVSAFGASLSASLFAMVCNLNVGRNLPLEDWEQYDTLGMQFQTLRQKLLQIVDEDTMAFNGVIVARRMPANTAQERTARNQAIEEAYHVAIQTPLDCARYACECLQLSAKLSASKLSEMLSDYGVGLQMAQAAFWGALYNVLINLKSVKDAGFAAQIRQQCEEMTRLVKQITSVAHHEVMLLLEGNYIEEDRA